MDHHMQDGKSKEVRASITTIKKGEDELTIYYIGHASEPIPQQRKELLMMKGFICECHRCSTEHDDTQHSRCINQESTDCHHEMFGFQAFRRKMNRTNPSRNDVPVQIISYGTGPNMSRHDRRGVTDSVPPALRCHTTSMSTSNQEEDDASVHNY
jgi:hypothetical protein